MATAIYISRDAVRQYVAHLKGMAERGEIEVGKTIFSIAVQTSKKSPDPQIGPPEMTDATKRNCRQLMMDCDFLSRVGNILSGKGILNKSFNTYSIDEITDLCMDAANATKQGRKPAKAAAREPEPEAEPDFLRVNVFQLVDVLNFAERAGLVTLLISTLTEPVEEMERVIRAGQQEIDRRDKEIVDIRAELRDTKAQLMQSREALGYAKTNVAPRVVERFVNLPNKPIPPGTQHGGTGGHAPGTIVVHRKPLMGHTPKVVREHEKKE